MADVRSDLYSLGVVIYEALAGRLPFQADNAADLIVAVLNAEAIPLKVLRPELGDRLSRIVSRCMARNPDERFQSTEELSAAIDAALLAHPEFNELMLPRRFILPQGTTTPAHSLAPLPSVTRNDRATQDDTLTELLVDPRKRIMAFGIGALAVIAAVAFSATMLGEEPKSQARAEQPDGRPVAAVAEPMQQKPVAQPPSDVKVELFGVPEGAAIVVDGKPSDDSVLHFARGSGLHDITVTVPGSEPWRVSHDARSDGRYALALDTQEVHRAPAAKPERASREERQARGERVRIEKREKKDSSLLRTPDF